MFDNDAIRFAEFATDFCRQFDASSDRIDELESHVDQFLKNKQPGQVDSDIVQGIKGLIRRGEAREGARCCGVQDERLHFMDMPFYETGSVKKRPLGVDRMIDPAVRHRVENRIPAACLLSNLVSGLVANLLFGRPGS